MSDPRLLSKKNLLSLIETHMERTNSLQLDGGYITFIKSRNVFRLINLGVDDETEGTLEEMIALAFDWDMVP